MQFGVSESIAHWGRFRPDDIALVCNSEAVTYGILNARINRLANELARTSSDPGRVAVVIKSKELFLESVIACSRLGRRPVVMHTGSAAANIRVNLRDTLPNLILVECGVTGNWASIFAEECQGTSLEVSKSKSVTGANWRAAEANARPEDEWGILFSSGSTGAPKAIQRDHYSIVTELLGWCLELGLRRRSTFYIARPVFYTGGLLLALSTLLVCGTLILEDLRDDEDANENWRAYQTACSRQQLDWVFMTPDQVRQFTKIANSTAEMAKPPKSLLVMGAPIRAAEKINAAKSLKCQVIESWGNSESLGTITDPEDLNRRPESVGRPFLTDAMFVIGSGGEHLQPNQLGKVAGSQDAGFTKYAGREEATADVRKGDLIISDDIGYVDDAGYFYVQGRSEDVVITPDRTLVIPEIESIVRGIPSVEDCCLVIVSRESTIPMLGAAVAAGDDVSAPDLLLMINDALGEGFQITRVKVLDSLPYLPVGKVDRNAVLELLTQDD